MVVVLVVVVVVVVEYMITESVSLAPSTRTSYDDSKPADRIKICISLHCPPTPDKCRNSM